MPFGRLFGRSDPHGSGASIGPAPPSLRPEALGAVLGTGAVRTPAFEERAHAEGIDLSRLWVATDATGLAAAALLVPHPGRTALLLASEPSDAASARTVGATCRALLAAELGDGIRLAQALSSPGDRWRASAWREAGLRHLATLEYLDRPLEPLPAAAILPEGVRLAGWCPSQRASLETLLSETYVDSLDCPGLAQMREPSDVLDGHLAAGVHVPDLWTLAWRGDRPVGALLMAPSPATGTVEVAYLGIVPSMRGRRLGSALLSHGLRQLSARSERIVSLAVDSANGPAAALYRRFGFRTVRRREAFVVPWTP